MGELGLLPEAERLVAIHATYSTVLQVMSAALANPFKDEGWTASFRELLARLTNYPSFERLRDDIKSMQAEVQAAAGAWYQRARVIE
jgi:glutamate-ammonia-ligase adenylyltransferase